MRESHKNTGTTLRGRFRFYSFPVSYHIYCICKTYVTYIPQCVETLVIKQCQMSLKVVCQLAGGGISSQSNPKAAEEKSS